jgi:hypothetical protein
LNEPRRVAGYPVPTYTTRLRNITGQVNRDGTVTVYAITAQTSSISAGEPDPTKLVMITDALAATALPTDDEHRDGSLEKFVTGDLAVWRSVSWRNFRAQRPRFMAPLKRRMGQPCGA